MPGRERMDQADLTLRQWVEALASAEPVPAGASLAAATAAGAAALAAKIARIAVRKRKGGRRDLPEYLQSLAHRLLQYADEDVVVYRAWREHRDGRTLAETIRVPLEIESLCRSAAESCLGLEAGLGAAVGEDVRTALEILEACARVAGRIAAANRRSVEAAT